LSADHETDVFSDAGTEVNHRRPISREPSQSQNLRPKHSQQTTQPKNNKETHIISLCMYYYYFIGSLRVVVIVKLHF